MNDKRQPRRAIYVESLIDAPLDRVWDATQRPESHQRWDVRFGAITYLPRQDGEPQRFTYATTVAPGVTIAGTGESLGERDRRDGTRWSGLKFWAGDRRSIIDRVAGYWRYIPTDRGVRFLTVDDDGAMCIRSDEQRFYEGPIAFRFPKLFSGVDNVRELWDDTEQRFHIEVAVANRWFGPLFGYRGTFTV